MTRTLHPVIEEDLRQIVDNPLPWAELAGTNILVTGASGFLPAYMVETILYLNDRGMTPRANVIGLVRSLSRARARFAAHVDRTDLELIEHDITLPWTTNHCADWIIHAASPASPKNYLADPVGTITPNVSGTIYLLELARKQETRGLLLFSSGEVYGPTPARVPTGEGDYGPVDPLDVRGCYAEGKRAAEALCAAWHRQYTVPTVIVRPFHTYGPGMRLDDGRVFADFIRDIVAHRNIRLSSDGTATRAFTYLADATLGYWTVLLRGERGAAYNVADDGGELSVKELAQKLAGMYSERGLVVDFAEKPITERAAASQLQRSLPDVTRLRQIGWKPTTDIETGFRRTVRYFE